jgi:hypothetical protein
VPFAALATLGCAVVTGVGAVLTAARAPRGAQVAVIGAHGSVWRTCSASAAGYACQALVRPCAGTVAGELAWPHACRLASRCDSKLAGSYGSKVK